jgi:eukaryotic-like serine/threonine-protein kinase
MPFDPQWLEASFPDLRDLTLIGRGGQKEVLRGQSITAGDTVVLKLCHLGSDRQRILREISAAQQLASSHVPNIVGYGEANSPVGQIIWLIEEYVEGQSLRGVLGNGPLPHKH